jgi:hypothetical protein
MNVIANGFVFTAALVLGTFVASFFWDESWYHVPAVRITHPKARIAEIKTPLSAQNLLGTWKGNWGRNEGECTLRIHHVDGDTFYGTLLKEGAEIRFEGTFNPTTRMLSFQETRVVRLGARMYEWSLGKNTGVMSRDGRILVGTGHDKWGQYSWAASNY